MRYSVILASIGALLTLAAGCTQADPIGDNPAGEGICITLDCGNIATRATADGVGNENRIKTVDYFLFDNTDPSTYPEYRYRGHLEPDVSSYFTFYIHSALVEEKTYTIYVIVNYPGAQSDLGVVGTSDTPSDKRTIAQLNELLLSESTARTFTANGVLPASDNDLFLVMTGQADVTIAVEAGKNLVGTANINLKRLAAKVTMDFYIKDEVVKTHGTVTDTWVPLTDGKNIRVYLCNGAESVKVDGTSPSPLSLFDYQPNTENTAIAGKTDYSTAFSSDAFYTYPETWTQGDREEPYLKLIVPWKCSRSNAGITTDSQKELYYKVMLPNSSFASNNWYHLSLDVTQLGSSADEDAVNVTCGYQVADWGASQSVSSTLAQGFYLDVNGGNLEIKTVSSRLDIPFFASGAVEITSYSVSMTDFKNNIEKDVTSDNPGAVTLSSSGDFISFRHTMDTNYDATTYDVSPYTFSFTVHLTGADPSWDKVVTITQYPPLYIDQVESSGVLIYGYHGVKSSSVPVYDNNGLTAIGSHYLGTITDPTQIDNSLTGNKNRYVYEIRATVLDFSFHKRGDDVVAVIGDPRSTTAADFGTDFGGKAAGTYNVATSALSGNYYPADQAAYYVISPSFRIGSSFGKTQGVTYEGAVKRCAAYQENGYPAGRWRLPTEAEIEFCIKLSQDNKIPELFAASPTAGYWAASKEARFSDQFRDMKTATELSISGNYYEISGTNYYAVSRCVYDTWYWGGNQYPGFMPGNYSTPTPDNWLGFQTSL